jgi:integrase/recombinase XerD
MSKAVLTEPHLLRMASMSKRQTGDVGTLRPAPVEYSAAVDRYLAAADLGSASRRVYRISLHGWAWPLVDRRAPTGRERRGAHPPVVPLALLDDPKAPKRLQRGLADRAAVAQPRTLARELACLRAATAWWLAQGWTTTDPATGLAPPTPGPGLTLAPSGASTAAKATAANPDRTRAALTLRAPLRELALWHLLHESRAPVEQVLALNIDHLDLPRRRTKEHAVGPLSWGPGTARLLPMLLAGRTAGPVFVTDRRAPAATPAADRCPVTGRGRLSYRRAAELFTAATRPLDPDGCGWTLLVLRDRASRNRSAPR